MKLRVSSNGMRIIDKKGIDEVLKECAQQATRFKLPQAELR